MSNDKPGGPWDGRAQLDYRIAGSCESCDRRQLPIVRLNARRIGLPFAICVDCTIQVLEKHGRTPIKDICCSDCAFAVPIGDDYNAAVARVLLHKLKEHQR